MRHAFGISGRLLDLRVRDAAPMTSRAASKEGSGSNPGRRTAVSPTNSPASNAPPDPDQRRAGSKPGRPFHLAVGPRLAPYPPARRQTRKLMKVAG